MGVAIALDRCNRNCFGRRPRPPIPLAWRVLVHVVINTRPRPGALAIRARRTREGK